MAGRPVRGRLVSPSRAPPAGASGAVGALPVKAPNAAEMAAARATASAVMRKHGISRLRMDLDVHSATAQLMRPLPVEDDRLEDEFRRSSPQVVQERSPKKRADYEREARERIEGAIQELGHEDTEQFADWLEHAEHPTRHNLQTLKELRNRLSSHTAAKVMLRWNSMHLRFHRDGQETRKENFASPITGARLWRLSSLSHAEIREAQSYLLSDDVLATTMPEETTTGEEEEDRSYSSSKPEVDDEAEDPLWQFSDRARNWPNPERHMPITAILDELLSGRFGCSVTEVFRLLTVNLNYTPADSCRWLATVTGMSAEDVAELCALGDGSISSADELSKTATTDSLVGQQRAVSPAQQGGEKQEESNADTDAEVTDAEDDASVPSKAGSRHDEGLVSADFREALKRAQEAHVASTAADPPAVAKGELLATMLPADRDARRALLEEVATARREMEAARIEHERTQAAHMRRMQERARAKVQLFRQALVATQFSKGPITRKRQYRLRMLLAHCRAHVDHKQTGVGFRARPVVDEYSWRVDFTNAIGLVDNSLLTGHGVRGLAFSAIGELFQAYAAVRIQSWVRRRLVVIHYGRALQKSFGRKQALQRTVIDAWIEMYRSVTELRNRCRRPVRAWRRYCIVVKRKREMFRTCFWPFYTWNRWIAQNRVAESKAIMLSNVWRAYLKIRVFNAWRHMSGRRIWRRTASVMFHMEGTIFQRNAVFLNWHKWAAKRRRLRRAWYNGGHAMHRRHMRALMRIYLYAWRTFRYFNKTLRQRTQQYHLRCLATLWDRSEHQRVARRLQRRTRRSLEREERKLRRRSSTVIPPADQVAAMSSATQAEASPSGATPTVTGDGTQSSASLPNVNSYDSQDDSRNGEVGSAVVVAVDAAVAAAATEASGGAAGGGGGDVTPVSAEEDPLRPSDRSVLWPILAKHDPQYYLPSDVNPFPALDTLHCFEDIPEGICMDYCFSIWFTLRAKERLVMIENAVCFRRVGRYMFQAMRGQRGDLAKRNRAKAFRNRNLLKRLFHRWRVWPTQHRGAGNELLHGPLGRGRLEKHLSGFQTLRQRRDQNLQGQQGMELDECDREEQQQRVGTVVKKTTQQLQYIHNVMELVSTQRLTRQRRRVGTQKAMDEVMAEEEERTQVADQRMQEFADNFHIRMAEALVDAVYNVFQQIERQRCRDIERETFRRIRVAAWEGRSLYLRNKAKMRNWLRICRRFRNVHDSIYKYRQARLKWAAFHSMLRSVSVSYTYVKRDVVHEIREQTAKYMRFSALMQHRGLQVRPYRPAALIAVTHDKHATFLRWVSYVQQKVAFRKISERVRKRANLRLVQRVFYSFKTSLTPEETWDVRKKSTTYQMKVLHMEAIKLCSIFGSAVRRALTTRVRSQCQRFFFMMRNVARSAPSFKKFIHGFKREVYLRTSLEQRLLVDAFLERKSMRFRDVCIPSSFQRLLTGDTGPTAAPGEGTAAATDATGGPGAGTGEHTARSSAANSVEDNASATKNGTGRSAGQSLVEESAGGGSAADVVQSFCDEIPPGGYHLGKVVVYTVSGLGVLGIQPFLFADKHVHEMPLRGVDQGRAVTFESRVHRGEKIVGLETSVGTVLEAVRFFTSTGRESPWIGDRTSMMPRTQLYGLRQSVPQDAVGGAAAGGQKQNDRDGPSGVQSRLRRTSKGQLEVHSGEDAGAGKSKTSNDAGTRGNGTADDDDDDSDDDTIMPGSVGEDNMYLVGLVGTVTQYRLASIGVIQRQMRNESMFSYFWNGQISKERSNADDSDGEDDGTHGSTADSDADARSGSATTARDNSSQGEFSSGRSRSLDSSTLNSDSQQLSNSFMVRGAMEDHLSEDEKEFFLLLRFRTLDIQSALMRTEKFARRVWSSIMVRKDPTLSVFGVVHVLSGVARWYFESLAVGLCGIPKNERKALRYYTEAEAHKNKAEILRGRARLVRRRGKARLDEFRLSNVRGLKGPDDKAREEELRQSVMQQAIYAQHLVQSAVEADEAREKCVRRAKRLMPPLLITAKRRTYYRKLLHLGRTQLVLEAGCGKSEFEQQLRVGGGAESRSLLRDTDLELIQRSLLFNSGESNRNKGVLDLGVVMRDVNVPLQDYIGSVIDLETTRHNEELFADVLRNKPWLSAYAETSVESLRERLYRGPSRRFSRTGSLLSEGSSSAGAELFPAGHVPFSAVNPALGSDQYHIRDSVEGDLARMGSPQSGVAAAAATAPATPVANVTPTLSDVEKSSISQSDAGRFTDRQSGTPQTYPQSHGDVVLGSTTSDILPPSTGAGAGTGAGGTSIEADHRVVPTQRQLNPELRRSSGDWQLHSDDGSRHHTNELIREFTRLADTTAAEALLAEELAAETMAQDTEFSRKRREQKRSMLESAVREAAATVAEVHQETVGLVNRVTSFDAARQASRAAERRAWRDAQVRKRLRGAVSARFATSLDEADAQSAIATRRWRRQQEQQSVEAEFRPNAGMYGSNEPSVSKRHAVYTPGKLVFGRLSPHAKAVALRAEYKRTHWDVSPPESPRNRKRPHTAGGLWSSMGSGELSNVDIIGGSGGGANLCLTGASVSAKQAATARRHLQVQQTQLRSELQRMALVRSQSSLAIAERQRLGGLVRAEDVIQTVSDMLAERRKRPFMQSRLVHGANTQDSDSGGDDDDDRSYSTIGSGEGLPGQSSTNPEALSAAEAAMRMQQMGLSSSGAARTGAAGVVGAEAGQASAEAAAMLEQQGDRPLPRRASLMARRQSRGSISAAMLAGAGAAGAGAGAGGSGTIERNLVVRRSSVESSGSPGARRKVSTGGSRRISRELLEKVGGVPTVTFATRVRGESIREERGYRSPRSRSPSPHHQDEKSPAQSGRRRSRRLQRGMSGDVAEAAPTPNAAADPQDPKRLDGNQSVGSGGSGTRTCSSPTAALDRADTVAVAALAAAVDAAHADRMFGLQRERESIGQVIQQKAHQAALMHSDRLGAEGAEVAAAMATAASLEDRKNRKRLAPASQPASVRANMVGVAGEEDDFGMRHPAQQAVSSLGALSMVRGMMKTEERQKEVGEHIRGESYVPFRRQSSSGSRGGGRRRNRRPSVNSVSSKRSK